jgi:ankyrin repeat protein
LSKPARAGFPPNEGNEGNEGIAAEYLLQSVRHGRLELLRKLLRRGVPPLGAVSADGLSSVGLAVVCGQQGALSMLLDHGVDPAVVDREGRTLLHLSAKRIAALSSTPRDVDHSNSLLICTQLVLERLRLKYAAPALREILDTVDAEGQAALHVAAAVPDQLMSQRLVRLLLYYSATPTKLSGTGLTAEMIARHAYNVESMNLLRNAAGASSQLSSEQLMPTPSAFDSTRVWAQQHNAGGHTDGMQPGTMQPVSKGATRMERRDMVSLSHALTGPFTRPPQA